MGSKKIVILVVAIVGAVLFLPCAGIVAAIAIPNLLSAIQRSKQIRTAGDMRALTVALEAYKTDVTIYPGQLSALSPKYVADLRTKDSWEHDLRYASIDGGRSYVVTSAGKDGEFQFDDPGRYAVGKTHYFNCDIVYRDGLAVQQPEGIATSLPTWTPPTVPPPTPTAVPEVTAEPLPPPETEVAESPEAPDTEEPVVESPAAAPPSGERLKATPPKRSTGGMPMPASADSGEPKQISMSQAKLVKQVQPVYPPSARKAKIAGIVIIEAIIESDGSVSETKVLKSVHPLLDQSALDAVKQWKFEPFMEGGHAVRFRLTVTVNFNIAD